jgi:outer membrane lipoprotein SlyB
MRRGRDSFGALNRTDHAGRFGAVGRESFEHYETKGATTMMQELHKTCALAFVLGAVFLTVACAREIGGASYDPSEVQSARTVQKGKVVGSRQITVQKEDVGRVTAISAAAGAITGAALGSNDLNKILAAAGGALAGGVVGATAESALSRQEATQYLVQLDSGTLLSVIQRDEKPLEAGTSVYIDQASRARIWAAPVTQLKQ